MYIRKNFSFRNLLQFSGHHFTWLIPFMTVIALLIFKFNIEIIQIPWQPVSVIGTAVAFYLGFKNNQSYDRIWEARKVWGAVVNTSRAWGASLAGFIDENKDASAVQRLTYRHIAWLYALRSQLLIPTPWEHINQKFLVGVWAKRNRRKFGIGTIEDEITKEELHQFLAQEEYQQLKESKNMATQIIHQQAKDLKQLMKDGAIDDFRHVELQELLNEMYVEQGKLERIKKFPLPRQYGGMSAVFVGIFIVILPLGIMPLFVKLGLSGMIMGILVSCLVAWIYLIMELVGDYSENPFEGVGNDIPMYSLCRTIEIDLREMLGESDLPPNIEAKNHILM